MVVGKDERRLVGWTRGCLDKSKAILTPVAEHEYILSVSLVNSKRDWLNNTTGLKEALQVGDLPEASAGQENDLEHEPNHKCLVGALSH